MIWNNFSKLTNFHLNKTVLLILTYNIASMFSEWHFLGNLCRNIFTLGNFTPDLCTTFSDHNLSLSQIEVSWSRCRLVYSKLPLRLAGIFQTKENHIPPKMGFSKDEAFLKPLSEIQNFITLYIQSLYFCHLPVFSILFFFVFLGWSVGWALSGTLISLSKVIMFLSIFLPRSTSHRNQSLSIIFNITFKFKITTLKC